MLSRWSQHCARYWAIGSILVLLTTVNLVVFSNLLARWFVGLSTIDYSADDSEYKEWHVGTYGIDAEQHFYIKGDSYVLRNEGRIYYITEFSPDEMTIYDATRPEGFQYGKYKKMNGRP